MSTLIFIPLILIVGYFLLIRPQQQRVRRQQQLMASISVGDQVVTAGGIVATVVSLEEDRASLEVSPGMTMVFLRQAISRRLEGPEPDSGGLDGKDGGDPGGGREDD